MTAGQPRTFPTGESSKSTTDGWLPVLRRYLLVATLANPIWEVTQLPLYTLWTEADPRRLLFALAHCTAGDMLIALATLVGALVLAGNGWPDRAHSYRRVGLLTVLFGVSYTLVSEWLNVTILRSWTYSTLMPVIPIFGIGVSPLLQWVVVPIIGLALARRRLHRVVTTVVSGAPPRSPGVATDL